MPWLVSQFFLSRFQDLVGRIAYHDGTVCTSHKCDDRASMPNVIAEQRDRIVEIGVYDLPVFIGAFYPLLVSSSWRSILVSVEGIT